MDEAKLQEIDERRARVLRDGTAAGALCMAADDVPDLVAEVRRLTAALDAARREGAEGMRERAVQACIDEEVRAHDDRAEVVQNPYRQLVDQAAQEGRARAACTLRFRIAALPLDAPGGGS